jgi:N-(2-amino-2-carboxyethyl)-L-glutamate synthase
MAIGLAQACRYLDLGLIVVIDPKINQRTLDILKAFGALTERVTLADANGNYLKSRLIRVQDLLERVPNSYRPNQYDNAFNLAAHYQTMKEIVRDCGKPPDFLLAATNTCGTIMGCAKYVRNHGFNTKMVAVDAVGSVIFGQPGKISLIPGHGAGRKSDLLDESYIDQVLHITDEECIKGCRELLLREAILAGGSSGAVVKAAKKLQLLIPAGSTCLLIFPDSGERYLDTIYNDDWVKKHFGNIEKSVSKTPIRESHLTQAYTV